MWFTTIVLKNVLRRPLRSALTVIAIAIAVGAVVSLVGIAAGFEKSFLDLYRGVGVDLIVVRGGAKQRLNSAMDQGIGREIEAIPGVKEVLPGLVDVVSFEEFGIYGVLVEGWIPETAVFRHLSVEEGRFLKRDDNRKVNLGSILAQNLDKKVGDRVTIFEEEFEVVGIFKSFSVFEDGALVMPLAELQRLMDRPNQVTGFSVILEQGHDEAALKEVRRRIEAENPGLTAMPTREHVESLSEIQVAKAMAWLTSSVAFLIGAFGMMNTMIMSVHERTREIGILRSIGWRKWRVVRMILLESVVLSLVGALLGSAGAFVLVRLLTRVPIVSGFISGRISPIFVLYGFLIALVVGLFGGLLPAIRAARMLPTAALRYE